MTTACAPRASIVTLTMNPALDITTDVPTVRPTEKMRCGIPRYDPGGGGINVARVAGVLGESTLAVFPVGGRTGRAVAALTRADGIPVATVDVGGATRESFTVNERGSGMQYRFVLPGPELTPAEQQACLATLRRSAQYADLVVASGSLPPGVDADFYQRVANVCRECRAGFVLDTSGAALAQIESGVYVLKPSVRELSEHVGHPLESERDQVGAARSLIDSGRAEIVVVSLGAAGALLVEAHAARRFPAVQVPVVSAVGAGDAMVAGITVGLARSWPLTKSVRLGIAAATAMLRTPGTATCTRADVDAYFAETPEPEDVEQTIRPHR